MKSKYTLWYGAICIAFAVTSFADTGVSWKGTKFADWRKVTSQVRTVNVSDAGMSFEVIGGDPQLNCTNCSFVSRTSQFFRFRIRAKEGGRAEIFWRSDDEPRLRQALSAEYQWIGILAELSRYAHDPEG